MARAVEDLREQAEHAATFPERQEARIQLYRQGAGPDPWDEATLAPLLDRAAEAGVAPALADAGRTILAADRLPLISSWLPRLVPKTSLDREALAVVRGLLAIREGENELAAAELAQIPHPEAVALHGIALMQLGNQAHAAARLEVLLAADALDDQGAVPATYLPDATPVLSLFLTACVATGRAHLRAGRRADALKHAEAGRDAVRRYPNAEVDEDLLNDLTDLLDAAAA